MLIAPILLDEPRTRGGRAPPRRGAAGPAGSEPGLGRLREDVLPDASPALECYLRGLGHAIRGNIDWALKVPRYTGAEHLADQSGEFGAEPSFTTTPSVCEPGPPGSSSASAVRSGERHRIPL